MPNIKFLGPLAVGGASVAGYAYDGLGRRITKSATAVAAPASRRHAKTAKKGRVGKQAKTVPAPAERQYVWRSCDEDKLILRDGPAVRKRCVPTWRHGTRPWPRATIVV